MYLFFAIERGKNMIECFPRKKYKRTFISNTTPILISASRIDSPYKINPRSMHSHDDIVEINFVREGSGIYIIDNRRYKISKGDIIICNSKVVHDEDSMFNKDLIRYDLAVSNIQKPDIRTNCLISDHVKPILNAGDYYDDLNNLMYVLFSQLVTKNDYAEQTCHYIMMSILTLCTHIIENTQPEHLETPAFNHKYNVVEEVKKYVNNHYSDELTLEDLANGVNLNPQYLSRIFKKETGYSPIQYVVRRRIGEAQTLLIKSKLSITEIASRVGYGNPNYFNVLFTKKVGLSPSEYRKIYVNLTDDDELEKFLKTK